MLFKNTSDSGWNHKWACYSMLLERERKKERNETKNELCLADPRAHEYEALHKHQILRLWLPCKRLHKTRLHHQPCAQAQWGSSSHSSIPPIYSIYPNTTFHHFHPEPLFFCVQWSNMACHAQLQSLWCSIRFVRPGKGENTLQLGYLCPYGMVRDGLQLGLEWNWVFLDNPIPTHLSLPMI